MEVSIVLNPLQTQPNGQIVIGFTVFDPDGNDIYHNIILFDAVAYSTMTEADAKQAALSIYNAWLANS